MADDENTPAGLRDRLTRQGEDALGKFAQDLLENPLVNGALARAFEAREKAAQAQEVAFGALNIPSAADLERLTRRVRSVSQRLEGIEDGVDRLDERFAQLNTSGRLEERLEAIEARLDAIAKDVTAVKKASGSAPRRAAARKPAARKPAARKTPAKRKPPGATKSA
jgi:TolA-binding protein